MTNETKQAIVSNAVRWASNMLVEVLGNYHQILSKEQHDALKRSVSALQDFDMADFEGRKA